ncbi:MAG: D-alanyl-D-alanine carboxypeptidase/D-alanyl-D-alanine-endopeptidase, partial [Opitutaceae bacterium]|nr:D-alanyl-D-alanine carboxypeptidase/D-alanyl-D-alanine-endopeptidase [Verrucomicrobiales bacterium]
MNIARSLLIWLAMAQAVSGATSTNLPPPPAASTADFQRQMAAHLAAPRFHTAQWGIKVVSLVSGTILFEHRTDQYFSPASNTKLFTTALALDKIGPNYRIKTSILAGSRPDASGRLPGDLIIFGRGDPTLNPRLRGGTIAKALDLFVNVIKAAGIKQINGDLIGDESYFKGPPFGAGWAINDLQSYFGAEITALSFNDNTLELSVKPASKAGAPASLSLSVATSLVVLSNRVTTVAKGGKTAVELYRPIGENMIYVSGTIAMEGSFKDEITLHRPARLFVELLRAALAQQNIAVTGRTRVMNWKDREVSPLNLPGLIEFGAVESLPLSDILREIQKPSQNLYTDLLLAHVGEVSRTKAGAGLTSEEVGIAALNTFLPKAGVKKSDILFEEGSGLSRYNLVTPNEIISLLTYMHRQPTAAVYFD